MKIEMTELEYLALFGENKGKKIHERSFELNGNNFAITEWYYTQDDPRETFYQNIVHLTLALVTNFKSPQEIAAEGAVQKAESALKAAKEVLNKVKEK